MRAISSGFYAKHRSGEGESIGIDAASRPSADFLGDEATTPSAAVSIKGCSGPKFVPILQDEDCFLDVFAAIYYGELESLLDVFEYDANVDVNQVDSLGRTPADFAAVMGQPEMMKLLIQKGGQHKVMNRPTMKALARKRAEAREKSKTTA